MAAEHGLTVYDCDDYPSNNHFLAEIDKLGRDDNARAIVIRVGTSVAQRNALRRQIRSTEDYYLDAPSEELERRIISRDGAITAYQRAGITRWRRTASSADLRPWVAEASARYRHSSPADFVGIPWMADYLDPPADSCWPRFMSRPHPEATGSYGADCIASAERRGMPLHWWQRLAVLRILEHDSAGMLVWPEWILTVARQSGKSWLLRVLALWRLDAAEILGEPQSVIHVANTIRNATEVFNPALAWAKRAGWQSWDSNARRGLRHPDTGGEWSVLSPRNAYGLTAGLALIDEAWHIEARFVTNGIQPTQVERLNPQMALISTAHPEATSLMADFRLPALDGSECLLLEWSSPPWLDDGDPAGWRMASPRWSAGRERLIRRAYRQIAAGAAKRIGDMDPIDSFRTQWLNRWPAEIDNDGLAGERLLPDGAWRELEAEAEVADDAAWCFALEDHAGIATAVAVAARTEDGRITVRASEIRNRADAFAWVAEVAEALQQSPLVLVGPVLQETGDAGDLAQSLELETVNSADTKAALALLRQLVSRRQVVHPAGTDLDRQIEACRVDPGALGLRLINPTQRSDLLRTAAWSVAAVERQRQIDPRVY
jgi:hypothetical protein